MVMNYDKILVNCQLDVHANFRSITHFDYSLKITRITCDSGKPRVRVTKVTKLSNS